MLVRLVTAIVTVALALGVARNASGQSEARPDLRAIRAAAAPVIDGALDDEAWQAAPLPTGEWLSYNPLYGEPIPQKTTVWFTYDSDYFYFAFKCDDPNPSDIKTSITRRDNIWNDDWVGVSLDALGTGQQSYHMMVNPSGVQFDMLNSVAGSEDPAPDWAWDSAGRLTETGYSVEIRLPLQSIRFKGGNDIRMGLLFWRRVSRSGMSVAWPPLAPGAWVFDRHASLRFDRLEPRLAREVLPSATYGRTTLRESPTRWGGSGRAQQPRRQHQARRDVDHHARRDRQSRFQPGRKRRVPGRGQPALPDLLRREAAVLHGRRRHLRAGRRRRRQLASHRGQHATHRRSDRRREGHRQRRPRDVRDADRVGRPSGPRAARGRPRSRQANAVQHRARAVQPRSGQLRRRAGHRRRASPAATTASPAPTCRGGSRRASVSRRSRSCRRHARRPAPTPRPPSVPRRPTPTTRAPGRCWAPPSITTTISGWRRRSSTASASRAAGPTSNAASIRRDDLAATVLAGRLHAGRRGPHRRRRRAASHGRGALPDDAPGLSERGLLNRLRALGRTALRSRAAPRVRGDPALSLAVGRRRRSRPATRSSTTRIRRSRDIRRRSTSERRGSPTAGCRRACATMASGSIAPRRASASIRSTSSTARPPTSSRARRPCAASCSTTARATAS